MESTKKQHYIPSEILDDLASRFIINIPKEEKSNLIRICFQIELAHWFFLDFLCVHKEQKLQSCGIKQFAIHLFDHVPFLRPHLANIDKVLEDWKQYKLSVPTYGAILISPDHKHVLLVQSYFAKSSWGFPKGKVNEYEEPVHCAAREVYEETGFDISKSINPNEYIELVINFQYTRLYLVQNVPMDFKFEPKTRGEIKCCEWFPVEFLPTSKHQMEAKSNLGISANSFFMILPFIKRLKRWLNDYENRSAASVRKARANVSTFCYETGTTGTYFADNNKSEQKGGGGGSSGRQRHKSAGDVEGFKFANFEVATPHDATKITLLNRSPAVHQQPPRESRRRLFAEVTPNPPKLFTMNPEKIKIWTEFKLDRARIMQAIGF